MDDWQHALGTQGGFDPYAHLATRLAEQVDRAALAAYVGAQAQLGNEEAGTAEWNGGAW